MTFRIYLKGDYWTTVHNCDNDQKAIDFCVKTFGGPAEVWTVQRVN